ncbi:MAG: PepSY-like domain-containing protein [Alistipes sp.]|nr:PepSY-like domain-containing protein [Alistipes sp.]MBQ8916311.1 PepSY-like domain-containing protein [Alistipes sp.]
MKKILWSCVLLLSVALPALADHYRSIELKALPRAAKEFLERHFDADQISYVATDRALFDRNYKVLFADGATIEFDKHGAWIEIDTPRGALPSAVVPAKMLDAVESRFEGSPIRKIERNRRGYEVELGNGIELTFDQQYRLVDVDD